MIFMVYKENEEIIRVRIPKQGEVFGIVTATLGAGRLEVKCADGFTRICRIPGKMRRRVFMRIGDLILVKPWQVQSNERADVIWMYKKNQADWLKEKGYLKNTGL
jgi:translation initiation factor 1A